MTDKPQHSCRPVAGDRVLNNEHLRDCNLSGCEGCKPCRPVHGHCERCRHRHLDASHPRVCPSCVGASRNDILEIVDQVDEAHRQLVHRSVNAVAFVIAGPAANYEAQSFVHQSATSGRLCKCARRGMVCPSDLPAFVGPVCDRCAHSSCLAARRPRVCPDAAFVLEETRDEDRHPLTVLSAWDITWRRALGHDPDSVTVDGQTHDADVTLTTTATYLLRNLTYMAQQPDEVADFAQFAREIHACRAWLTEVLRLGHKPDRGVDCPVCGRARLEKHWDDTDEGSDTYDESRLTKPYADMWVCPNAACGQTWTEDEYRERVQGIYVGVADRLTASDIQKTYRVPESTTRSWASKGLVSRAGKDSGGRQLYRVSDVLAQRDRALAERDAG